jgi:hypothetical protein
MRFRALSADWHYFNETETAYLTMLWSGWCDLNFRKGS